MKQVINHIDVEQYPIYLLTGEYDYSSPPEATKRLVDNIPGIQMKVMPGLGHFPMTENPDEFRPYLLRVLSELQ